jgi:Leucine-rich repeat (LRR) protein
LCSCATQQESVNDKKTITVARVNDNNFRAYLLDNGYAKPYIGKLRGRDRLTPQDEWVESTPLGRSTQLIDCHRKKIHSLDGIELFPNLVILICSENPISRLDLRHNPKLKQLVAIETPPALARHQP